MVFSFFKRSSGKGEDNTRLYQTPAGQSAYVIGDIHGCLDKLLSLLDTIDNHIKTQQAEDQRNGRDKQRVTIAFLGDLMDRGPNSYGVVEYLRQYKPADRDVVFLMGNHEEVFLKVVEGNISAADAWFEFGGRDCLRSYDVDNLGEILLNPDSLLYRIQAAVPQSHIDFIQSFRDYYEFGDYLFVHAGIRPRTPIKSQSSRDMRWIRESFLKYKGAHPLKIIHGHTVVDQAEDLGNRIAVDTGACRGGALTAVYIHNASVEFFSTSENSGVES